MRLHVEKIRGWVTPADAFIALYSEAENSFWLDREHNNDGRFSVIGSGVPVSVDAIAELGAQLDSYPELDLPFAFRPGLVGIVNFDDALPTMLRVGSALVFDHDRKTLYFIAKTDSDAKFKNWLDAALLRIGLIGGEQLKYLHGKLAPKITEVIPRHSDSEYLELIERVKSHIAAGDVYQLCLTNELELVGSADPLSVFLSLRSDNPAPYASIMKIDGRVLVSSSPEQFLKVERTGRVSSKPIKGTRRRDSDPAVDAEIAEELAENIKERAENLMIVDLMRNDLSRVCDPDSVTVDKLFDVESYQTVHQLVSTVSGQLLPGFSALNALEAAFPGGSMTGAPKPKAVELIGALEGGPRGIYSGVAGYIGDDGSAEFGMVIRSLVFEGERITLGVGGGITIDSDAEAELAETKLKAQALLRALLVA
jgi:anthranilate/para-aminobenzoate synthase component I